MIEFVIEQGWHPNAYPLRAVNWLKWEEPNCTTRVNVDFPLAEVEATLKTYIGTKGMDNLDFLRALQLVRTWKRSNPEDLAHPGDVIREFERMTYDA